MKLVLTKIRRLFNMKCEDPYVPYCDGPLYFFGAMCGISIILAIILTSIS